MAELETLQLVWIFFSIITLVKWLIHHDLGRSSLKDIEIPSNNFTVIDIIAGLAIFMLISGMSLLFVDTQSPIIYRVTASACCNLVAIAMLLPLLNMRYTKGLKAVLPAKNKIASNVFKAICYSVPAYGLAAFVLAITVFTCSQFNYNEVQQHEFLKIFSESSKDFSTITIMYISTSVITPILEETLFRGLIQTSLIKITQSKWTGIFMGAIIFAVMHANAQHMPALLLLGTFFGYAFAKHQSLLIPILMHAIFNAINVTGAILSSN